MYKVVAFSEGILLEISLDIHYFYACMCVSIINFFCYFRWLLLDFKREFIFMDSLRILEVLTSNHLELSSDRAAIEQEKVAAEEFAADGNL